jgi:hypothetical protein
MGVAKHQSVVTDLLDAIKSGEVDDVGGETVDYLHSASDKSAVIELSKNEEPFA